MVFFRVCFLLYFFKFSTGNGFFFFGGGLYDMYLRPFFAVIKA